MNEKKKFAHWLLMPVLACAALAAVASSKHFHHLTAHQKLIQVAVIGGGVLVAYGLIVALLRATFRKSESRPGGASRYSRNY